MSHLDTHKHTHIFPKVLRPLLRAAAECEVRAVRDPFGPRLPLRLSELLKRPGPLDTLGGDENFGNLCGKIPEGRAAGRLGHAQMEP